MGTVTHLIMDDPDDAIIIAPPGRPPLCAAKLEKLRALEAEGLPRYQMCATLGVDPKTAVKYLGPRKTWRRGRRKAA